MRVTRTPLGRSDGRHPLRTSLASVTTRGRGRQFVVLGPVTAFVLLHISTCVAIVADSRVDGGRDPPISFSIQELINHERADELKEVLTTTGLLAVRLHDGGSDADYAHNRQVALDGLCSCYDHPSFLQIGQGTKDQVQQQIRSMVLPDHRTVRTTVATGMVGMDNPLPLPAGLSELCGTDVTDAMEGLRDQLAEVSHAFVRALDHTIGRSAATAAGTAPLLKDKHGKSYHSVQSIVQAANHLEHFHVYTSTEAGNQKSDTDDMGAAGSSVAWDWHTDAGLFLVFVPAWNCQDSGNGDDLHQDNSFWYRDSSGQPIQATFSGQDTAIIMLGQGAQDWLDLSTTVSGSNQASSSSRPPALKATVHSVQWEDKSDDKQLQQQQQQRRSWYGMMTLVPETAIIHGSKTLREVRSSLSLSNSIENKTGIWDDDDDYDSLAVVSLGCGIAEASQVLMGESRVDEKPYLAINTRRRIQHQDPSGCNNVTNFFCWMQCLEVPNADNAQTYANNGYSLYCLDPAILASSTSDQVSKAAEPCANGWVHNADCLGSWQPTAPGVPAANVNVTADSSYSDDAFCYGGTSMYMDGFHLVQSTTCVIYLFQSWVLNSAGKYAAAAIGTFVAAIGLEKIIQQRRKVMARMESARPRTRLLATAVFYGTQLALGYLLMLVVMIYSGVLFMAIVLGLVSGHILFNAKDAFFPLQDSTGTTVLKGEGKGEEEAVFVSEGTAVRTNERSSAEGEAGDLDLPPCCCDSSKFQSMKVVQSSAGEEDASNYGSLNDSKKTSSARILTNANTGYVVPEGITPCCQNIL